MPSNLPRIAGLALAGLLILVPHEALAQRGGRGGYYPGGGYGGYGYGYRGGYGRYGYPGYGYGYGYPAYAYPGYGYGYPPYPAYYGGYGGYYGYGGAALATGVLIGAAIAANRHRDHYIQVPVQVPYQAPAIEQPAIAPPPADPMQTCPDGSVVPANSYCPRHYRGAGARDPRDISPDDLRPD
ncbi:MAG TPA: hypothetical protein VEW04_10590 [Allosphingosinicella sp.]|nr:hypothetical protein [Allosphingosinicella sp.]